MGRGDALKVQARPFGSTSWRNLPVLMGGQSSLDGAFTPDSPGQWATVVYDLSALAGQRAKLRLQITADSAGQGVGVLVRELYAVTLPQTVVGGLDETFTSYLDTSGSGRWWSARTLTGSEVQPPWGRLPHAAGVPEELGGSYLGLGDGKAALPANTQFLLTSPPMDLRGTSNPTLQWWQTFQPTDGADGTVLEVSTDGGVSFRPLEPDGHTYVDDAPALDGPGWAGPQFGFVTDTFDLTPYASSDVRLRLASAVGPDPFASRWLLDDVKVVDRLGSSKPLLSEDGLFLTQRWNREAGQWQDVPLATAIASGRSGLDPVKVVQATGAATAHSIALPASTPRGPLVATVLYGGLAKTYGGAVKTSDLFLQLQSQLVGLQLANDLDGGDTLLRGRTFTVQGRLQGVDGSALAERLIQVFLDGQAVGSARTGADGHFQTGPILAAKALELGQRTLRVAYGGDAFDYVVGTAVERPYALKGIAQLQLESQVARGDTLEVAVRILDDVGKPLARTGAVVTVDGADPQQVVTDGNGRATFTTPVPVDKDTQVVYAVAAVGSQDVLGSDLKQETLVPAAPAASLLPWVVGAAALLLAVAVALAVYLLRRRKAVELQAALAAQVERTRYQLSTGDPLRESIFALYAGFLEALRAAGRPASDVQTPREIAASLRSALKGADQADVDQLTDLFSRARYSDAPLGEPARGAAVGCLDRIRGALAPEAAA
jgi:hypothetical protein